MEAQDQRKILAPDNHGVHLCHKCGWPFPNPHPSARHRRAHKRVCGEIDGYKLIDSEASNHSTCSDDELVSDDDNQNPTPKIMETSNTEKGTDKLEEKLKRSEDDEFADAVAEFSDGKLVGNSKNSAAVGEMDESNRSQSFKDCEISDLDQLPSTPIDQSLLHHPEIASGTVDRSVAAAEDTPSLQSMNIPTDINIDHKEDSTGDLYPIKSEPEDDRLSGKDVISIEENMNSDSNIVVETIQTEPKIEETIERGSEDSHSNDAIKTLEQELKIEETIERALDLSAFAKTEIPWEVAAKSCSSDDLLENKDEGEGHAEEHNSNMHVLSVVDVLNISDHSKALPKDFKDSLGMKLEQLASPDSIAGIDFGEDELKTRNEGSKEEMPVQGKETESFVSDSHPKEEIDCKNVPKDLPPVDYTSNVSVVISAIEDAPDEGVNTIDKSYTTDPIMENLETPQTKHEEIKDLGEEHLPMAAESIEELQDDGSYRELPKTDPKYTDSVSNSSTDGINTSTLRGSVEHENLKQNLGMVESMEDKILTQVEEGVASSEPSQVEGNDNFVKPLVNASDSSSQTDSVEGNWGSVLSVFSTRSDVQAVVQNVVVPPTNNQAPAEAEKNGWTISKASSRSSDKSDVFEPPSFMTLVEPGRVGGQKITDSEIQNVLNTESTTLQAGWFPSSHVPRGSDGRKKNEEIIAKVTNWSTDKEQHTLLKNLLGRAATGSKPKSPRLENTPPLIRKDAKTANDKGATIDSFLAGDSPTRLPVEIKREKKKVKGRPYWAQFVCCTSPNY